MAIAVGTDLNLSSLGPAISDALAISAGTRIDQPHKRAKEFMHLSQVECAEHCLQASGVDTRGMSRANIAQRAMQGGGMRAGGSFAHTTSDFPSILGDSLGKVLGRSYLEAPSTWQEWARRHVAKDLKPISTVRIGEAPNLLETQEGVEYQECTIGEAKEVYSLVKYGRLFSITWESLINDDLLAFFRIVERFGDAARRLENNVAYAPLIGFANGQVMSDTNDLFDATNHSNQAASGAALSVASLGEARSAMRLQTGIDPATQINVEAKYLIVPTAIETVAEQLIASVVDPAAAVTNVMNPFANKLKVIPEPLLDTGSPGSSTTAWYLVASPSQIDTVEVAFLQGEEEPSIETIDGFNTDGKRYRIRHLVAAAAIDWRGFYKNPGA